MEFIPICSLKLKNCEIINRNRGIDEKKISINKIYITTNTITYWIKSVKLYYTDSSISLEDLYKSYEIFTISEDIEHAKLTPKLFLFNFKELLDTKCYEKKKKKNKVIFIGLGMKKSNITFISDTSPDEKVDEQNNKIKSDMKKMHNIQNKIKEKLANDDNKIINDNNPVHEWINNFIEFNNEQSYLLLADLYESYIGHTNSKINLEDFKILFNNNVRGKVEAALYKGTIKYCNITFKSNKIKI